MYLTEGVPAVTGKFRERMEDFVVEELPLYEPAGVGDHCYIRVQKAGVSTHEAIRRLARELRARPEAFGYAGMKDAKAIAVQTFSIQGVRPREVAGLTMEGVTVLDARLHKNKLRLGHLRGNRFLLRLRGAPPEAEERCRQVFAVLSARGLPNLFGRQRFGSKGDAHEAGRAIVKRDAEALIDAVLLDRGGRERDPRLKEARERCARGDYEGAHRAFPQAYEAERRLLEALARGREAAYTVRRIPRATFRLYLSAYQSHLFNRLLLARMPDLHRLEPGDLAFLHDRGAVFLVKDPAAEQPRADRLEISPSGPLFGRKVTLAEGAPGERERAVLDDERLTLEDFRLPGHRLDGERRPFRVPVTDAAVRAEGDGVVLLSFALPKGSYATSVLREVMKSDDPDLD